MVTPILTPVLPTDRAARTVRPPYLAAATRLARAPFRRAWQALQDRRDIATATRLAPAILRRLMLTDPASPRLRLAAARGGDPVILRLVGPDRPDVIVRVARDAAARRGLEAARRALDAIPAGVPEAATILPRILGSGEEGGRTWLAEAALGGVTPGDDLTDPGRRARLLDRIAEAIAPIHAAGRTIVLDDELVDRWVRRRLVLAASLAGRPALETAARLAAARSSLVERVAGAEVRIGWIHGDLWPSNVLVEPTTRAVIGLVDWDSAADDELALQDRLHLALTTRRRTERRALGAVLASLLERERWPDEDTAALGRETVAAAWTEPAAGLDGFDARTAVLLYWLRFVEANVARHPGLARDRLWIADNVTVVISCL